MTTRDENGRFLPGNPGGPGRPARLVEEAYLFALREECPLEKWREVVRAAVASAVQGDPRARDFLGKHLLPDAGTPVEDPEPTDRQNLISAFLETLSPDELRVINSTFERFDRCVKQAALASPNGDGSAEARGTN